MKRVIVSVSNDISTDQRVAKICETMLEEGYEVLLVGRLLKNSKPLDRNYKIHRFKMFFHKSVFFYAEYNIRLFFLLLTHKKDILYSNDADTLLPNYFVSRLQSIPIIFDSHELFSEVPEIANKPFVKKVWRKIENSIIPKLDNIITVSEGIKNYYEKLYKVYVSVVRNVPIQKEVSISKFDFSTKGKRVILYQGAVNVGRGLELMIDTIQLLDNWIFVIIGDGDILQDLEKKVLLLNLENKVKFLGKVTPKKLKNITPLANIGISLEEDLGLNYHFALPNKLFDYIQAEVPVIVSSLPEMQSLVKDYKIGEVLLERTPENLAKLILKVDQKDYATQLKKAKSELTWENEKENFQEVLKSIS